MSPQAQPIAQEELQGLFGPLLSRATRVALAVSGGCDSTCLMVLFADWMRQVRGDCARHSVLTVDHGLRAESASEAESVAGLAATLGFRHATLRWDGVKPTTGIQAAARAARYRLLTVQARAQGIGVIVTAHTLDDQAETVLMRMARGSGLDGLGAMAAWSPSPEGGGAGIAIARPLLGVPKARLAATLDARGIGWSEDPSNAALTFERPRLRAAQVELEALGLTAEALGESARRLRRARTALDAWVADFCAREHGAMGCRPFGVIWIDRAAFNSVPEEIALRVLGEAIEAAGGDHEPVSLAKLESLLARIHGRTTEGAWTLARAKVSAGVDVLNVRREPGRQPVPELTLAPGARLIWDGRFVVAAGPSLPGGLMVRELGDEGVRILRAGDLAPLALGAGILRTLPGLWRGRDLISVPTFDFYASGDLRNQVSVTFPARGNYNINDRAPDLPKH